LRLAEWRFPKIGFGARGSTRLKGVVLETEVGSARRRQSRKLRRRADGENARAGLLFSVRLAPSSTEVQGFSISARRNFCQVFRRAKTLLLLYHRLHTHRYTCGIFERPKTVRCCSLRKGQYCGRSAACPGFFSWRERADSG